MTEREMTERDWKKDLEICEKATPGPWVWEWGGDCLEGGNYITVLEVIDLPEGTWPELQSGHLIIENEADRIFIATAREALPYYITEWKAEHDRRVELEKEIERLRE